MMARLLDPIRQDARYGLRAFRRHPGFAAVAIATLAVGIGATTAIYSVVDGVLLDPPPYRSPGDLVTIWHRYSELGGQRAHVAGPDVAEYRESSAFEGIAFIRRAEDRALDGSTPGRHVRVGIATPDLFAILGIEAAVGRTFAPDEGVLGAPPPEGAEPPPGPLVLGHGLWQTEFGGDADVVGRTVRLSGASWQIIGVLPADFDLVLPAGSGIADDVDAWTTLPTPLLGFQRATGLRDQDSDNTGLAIGRLATGATVESARADLSVIGARQREQVEFYRDAGLEVETVSLHEALVAEARPVLIALMGAVVFVLLISCINVANLLLARASDRASEMAVRAAIGAGRGRLVRQIVTESVLLAAVASIIGGLIAVWGVDGLLALAPDGLPRGSGASVNGRVLGMAILASSLAAVLFGAGPALAMARARVEALRSAGARGGGGRRWSVRRGLVVAEVALSFVLLAGAGIALRSALNLTAVETGFDEEGLYTFAVTLPGGTVGGPASRAEYMSRLVEGVEALPDVTRAGIVGGLPLGGVVFRQPWGPEGSDPEEWSRNEADFRVISSGFFEAMGTRLIAGRAFTRTEDVVERERVAVVSASLAARLSPGGNAVGRTIGVPLDGRPVAMTVVGIVEDVRFHDLREPGGEAVYVPYRQEASRTVSVAVRTRGEATGLEQRIRAVAAVVPSDAPIPLFEFRDMADYVGRSLAPTRFAAVLIAGFALIALGLSAVGLAGVLSYMVSRRTREFGIRIALGADPGKILRHVLGGGAGLAVIGVGLGVLIALLTSSGLRAFVFGVRSVDPVTWAVAGLTLLLAAVVASWVPARRAASLEPLDALGTD